MKFTLKENVNTESFVLKHNILLQANGLAMGREGVLQTEKDLYLIIAFVDNLIEEDLIEECNNDERGLTNIVLEDIEPFFFNLIKIDKYNILFKEVEKLFLQRCKEIWDNQHSIVGLFDSLLTAISLLDTEDKKEILETTGKMAEKAFEKRTQIMEAKTEETNSKLEELIKQYQKRDAEIQEKQQKEAQEKNNTEE